MLFRRMFGAFKSSEQVTWVFSTVARQPTLIAMAAKLMHFFGSELMPHLTKDKDAENVRQHVAAASKALRLGLASSIVE